MQVNELFCIGSNKFGQSGAGKKYHNQTFNTFNRIVFPVFIKQVVCGSHHSGLLTLDGCVYMMGSNINGVLGTPTSSVNYSYSPILVENLQDVSKISSGYHHMCAISQGKLYSWGKGVDGQLGTGRLINCALPTLVQSFGEDVQEVSCGLNHTLVKTTNRKCYSFGNGIYGQLGVGNNKNSSSPVPVKIDYVDQIAAGENFSLFLKDQTLLGSGDNSFGQISNEFKRKYALQPVQIKFKNVTAIRAGKFAVAVIQDRQLSVWGFKQSNGCLTLKCEISINQSQNASFCENSIMDLQIGGNMLYCLNSQGQIFQWKTNQANLSNIMKQAELKQKTILGFSVGQSHAIILGDITNQVTPSEKPLKLLQNIADLQNTQNKMLCSKISTQKISVDSSIQGSSKQSICSQHFSRTPSSIMRQPNNFIKAEGKQSSQAQIQIAEFLKQNFQKIDSKSNMTSSIISKQKSIRASTIQIQPIQPQQPNNHPQKQPPTPQNPPPNPTPTPKPTISPSNSSTPIPTLSCLPSQSRLSTAHQQQITQCLAKVSQIMVMLEKNNQIEQTQSYSNLSEISRSRRMNKSKFERNGREKDREKEKENRVGGNIGKVDKSNRELIMELRDKEFKISQLQQRLSRKQIEIQSQRQLINLLRKMNGLNQ